MKKKHYVGVMVTGLMTAMLVPGQVVLGATDQIKFNKSEINVIANKDFSVTLEGEGLKDVYGYEVVLSFNPQHVETVGKPVVKFAEGFSAGPKKADDGKIYFGFTQMGNQPGKSGNINLGEFKFKTKTEGIQTINLECIKIVDSKMNAKDYDIDQTVRVKSEGKQDNRADLLEDIKNHWAENSIRQIVNKGYMVGKTDKQFNPNDFLTRAEMAAILSRLVQLPDQRNATFKDVKGDEWYANNVLDMATKGFLRGYEDQTFKPSDNITRAETVVILARMEKTKNTYNKPQDVENVLNKYEDKTPTWAKEETAWAIEKGIVKGYTNNKINMDGKITRAEIAGILCRLLEIE